MQYDPIKRSLGKVFNQTPFLRKLFYNLLDTLLLRSWHVRKELRSWARKAEANSRVLDAGSGFGQYSYFISKLGNHWKIEGVDVKTEQIGDCNLFFSKIGLKDRVHFEEGDLTTFNRPETYNLILSVDVMEHIEEDCQVFRNFHNSLKEGGTLLISTPSDQGGSDVHDHDHHDEAHGFIDEHVRDGYSVSNIKEKLTAAGFKNVEARYTYGKSGQLAWKLSMKYPILLLNTSKIFFLLLPIYYLVTFPFCAILNRADVRGRHSSGTGLLVKAEK